MFKIPHLCPKKLHPWLKVSFTAKFHLNSKLVKKPINPFSVNPSKHHSHPKYKNSIKINLPYNQDQVDAWHKFVVLLVIHWINKLLPFDHKKLVPHLALALLQCSTYQMAFVAKRNEKNERWKILIKSN